MRQYIFDDDGLKRLLKNAYSHGYVEGIDRSPPKLEKKKRYDREQELIKHIDWVARCADMSALIAGEYPILHENLYVDYDLGL